MSNSEFNKVLAERIVTAIRSADNTIYDEIEAVEVILDLDFDEIIKRIPIRIEEGIYNTHVEIVDGAIVVKPTE